MDRLDAMRAYVQVVESGSYTKAAQLLDVHKATVSEQIRQLEETLGCRLLNRTTRSVAPTSEGLNYYRSACLILQQVDEAEASVRKGASSPSGLLRVQVPVAIGRLILAPESRSFLDRYPKIVLDLGCTDRIVDLVSEGLDCALRGGELPDSRLTARRLGSLRFVLCAAPRYLDQHGAPEAPEDLECHAQVGYRSGATGRPRSLQLMREGRAVEVPVPARFITTDSGALLSAGLDGLGIIQLAEWIASSHIATGALVPILPDWKSASLPIHLVAPSSRKRAARVQAFMDWAHALLLRRLGPYLEAA